MAKSRLRRNGLRPFLHGRQKAWFLPASREPKRDLVRFIKLNGRACLRSKRHPDSRDQREQFPTRRRSIVRARRSLDPQSAWPHHSSAITRAAA